MNTETNVDLTVDSQTETIEPHDDAETGTETEHETEHQAESETSQEAEHQETQKLLMMPNIKLTPHK